MNDYVVRRCMAGLLVPTLALLMIVEPYRAAPLGFSTEVYTQPDSQTFVETGYSVEGPFLSYWQKNGGLMQHGYPISDEFEERSDLDGKSYIVQYFERSVFELHPEQADPKYHILLSHLGTFRYRQKYPMGTPTASPNTTLGSSIFPQTSKRLGGTFQQYWQTNGGLPQFGFPISDEFMEMSDLDGKPYMVQYFERAVFELHPENQPPFDVLLSHLGKSRYDRHYSPAAWLHEHVIPLRTTEVSGDNSDLAVLRQIVGDARIVALGEATHSGHEFFTMKHRIIQFLVQHMGFTVVAFEDGWAESEGIDKYIRGAAGSGKTALHGLYHYTFPWGTEEILALVEWMRLYNQENLIAESELSFQGFDMQDAAPAINYVLEYLGRIDPSAVSAIAVNYSCFRSIASYRQQQPLEKHRCVDSLRSVYSYLLQHKAEYSVRASAQDFAKSLFSARTVVQAGEYWGKEDGFPDIALRDKYMAENTSWIIEQAGPTAKVIVWAHNQHVQTVPVALSPPHESMGQYLKGQYRDNMVVLGLDFYTGVINALSGGEAEYTPREVSLPLEDSYERYFYSAGIPIFLLDLREVHGVSGTTKWLQGPKRLWSIGEHYPASSSMTRVSLLEAFDVILFIERITPSRRLE